jgi:hypothetical protein
MARLRVTSEGVAATEPSALEDTAHAFAIKPPTPAPALGVATIEFKAISCEFMPLGLSTSRAKELAM